MKALLLTRRSIGGNSLWDTMAAATSKETEIKLTNVGRASLEKEFVEQGGLRERMTKARLNYRNQRPRE